MPYSNNGRILRRFEYTNVTYRLRKTARQTKSKPRDGIGRTYAQHSAATAQTRFHASNGCRSESKRHACFRYGSHTNKYYKYSNINVLF